MKTVEYYKFTVAYELHTLQVRTIYEIISNTLKLVFSVSVYLLFLIVFKTQRKYLKYIELHCISAFCMTTYNTR